MNMSAACSALDALDRRMVQVTPLGIQGEGCRLGEKTHRVLDRRPGADKPSPSGGAASVPSPLRYGATGKLTLISDSGGLHFDLHTKVVQTPEEALGDAVLVAVR